MTTRSGHDPATSSGTPESRGRRRRLLAVAAGATGLLLGAAPAAAAADCPTGTLLALLCRQAVAPPTTSPPVTAPPATAPALPALTTPPVTAPALPAVVGEDPGAARRLLELANAARDGAGVARLVPRDDVTAIALAHSHRMAAAGNIFHNADYFSAAARSRLNAAARGENVAYNPSVDDAHARLMASPGHRANLLDRRFSVAGFAVVKAVDGRYFVTQDFLAPAGAPRAAPAPRPAATRTASPARSVAAAPAAAPPAAPVPTPTASPPAEPRSQVLSAVVAAPRPLAARAVPPGPDGGPVLPLAATAVLLLGAAGRGWWLLHRRGRG